MKGSTIEELQHELATVRSQAIGLADERADLRRRLRTLQTTHGHSTRQKNQRIAKLRKHVKNLERTLQLNTREDWR